MQEEQQDKHRATVLWSTLAALLLAAVWGYFADLRDGQTGWFIGRLLFCGGLAFWLASRRQLSRPD